MISGFLHRGVPIEDYLGYLENHMDEDEDEEPGDDHWYNDIARNCIGWEEDMIKNGEF